MDTSPPRDPKPIIPAGTFGPETKHRNPVIAALWKAHHAIDEADLEARRAVLAVIVTHSSEGDFPESFIGRDTQHLAQVAGEMGDEDGWDLAPPRFRASHDDDVADAYRDAYRNAAADRVSEILS